MTTKTAIVIRDMAGTEVHRVDVTGRDERQVERIERGLAMNFDFTRYTFSTEEVQA